ncbi:hypothetical protein EST38_g10710 [Candolleomyces aberdarensis]|uniref:Uncharacterized protein n=1 Tax=Candolleomyces aberdarensis TaxID=2316362 RepID=A0A4Q2D952_9AGAR|nr:hypothetical protein EST38_g10710 [Candolleomyces aberdarensis]
MTLTSNLEQSNIFRLRTHWTLTDEYVQLNTLTILNLAGGIALPLGTSITQIPIVHTLD